MTTRTESELEDELQRQIQVAIGSEPDLLLVKNSNGKARYVTENGDEFFVPYGLGKGSPDLVGMLRVELRHREKGAPVIVRSADGANDLVYAVTRPVVVGVWFCLEVKTPNGVVEPEQEKCHAIWRRFGAFVAVVRSVKEARDALKQARRFES